MQRLTPGFPFVDPATNAVWTFTSQGILTPSAGPFPRGDLWQKIIEERSGRVVGIDSDELYVLDAGASRFHVVAPADSVAGYRAVNDDLRYISRLELTIVKRRGEWLVLKGETLQTWPLAAEARQVGIFGLSGPTDLPGFGALLFEDERGRMVIRTDDGKWFPLMSLWRPDRDFDWTVYELQSLNRVVVVTPFELVTIDMPRTGAEVPRARSIFHHDGHLDNGTRGLLIKVTGEFLFVKPAETWFGLPTHDQELRKVTATGEEPVSGAKLNFGEGYDQRDLIDLTSMNRVLVRGLSSLSLYDGRSLVPIDLSRTPDLGRYTSVLDMPSIKRIFLNHFHNLYELTSNGVLNKLELPVRIEPPDLFRFTDIPSLGMVLVVAWEGLFSLDEDLHFERLPAPSLPGYSGTGVVYGQLPGKRDILFQTSGGSYLLIDRRTPDERRCDAVH